MQRIEIQTLSDIELLVESQQVEFKLAAGKDGFGTLPKDFWPSYSAMANCKGGWIILGVKEKEREFIPIGISEPDKLLQDLFNQLNDRDKVSINLLTEESILRLNVEQKTILAIYIPPAIRKQKPVHLKKSPFSNNTFVRIHDGDRPCSDESVKRMLAEQIHDSRDDEILSEHYNFIDDIDLDSLKIYRNLLSAHSPHHPYLDLQLFELFKKIGGWRKDRETGKEGITLAGVLMFGQWEAITAAAPHYFVDYQERPEARTELRWVDRVVPDGTWSGNLFDFYRKVYQKLTADLKVPFHLENGQRKTDTPIHTALREALVNTLVHADYTERVSVLVVKRPDLFGFRNPGLMRIQLEDVITGGISDCRNRLLHQMFLLIGLGERAGSGIPKIYSGWKFANWRTPKLHEKEQPAQTILELLTASLIPDNIRQQLTEQFGERFNQLPAFEQLIVAAAAIEGYVNHERACQLTSQHSREVTLALPKLEAKGFLQSTGEYKQKFYTLLGVSLPTPEDVFSENSTYSGLNSTYSDLNSTHNIRDKYGRLLSDHFKKPFVDSLELLEEQFKHHLFSIAVLAREKKSLPKETMQNIICELCSEQFISTSILAELLQRNPNSIRQQYLKDLVDNTRLELAFPQLKNTPKQGYSTVDIKGG